MKSFWSEVSLIASSTEGINKPARGWEMKYGRLRKQYEKYLRNVNVSGREGDDEELFEKPPFFEEIHQLERPLGAMSAEMEANCNIFLE